MAIQPKGGGPPIWRGMLADVMPAKVTRVTVEVTAVTHCATCGQRLPAATKGAAKQKAYRQRKKSRQ